MPTVEIVVEGEEGTTLVDYALVVPSDPPIPPDPEVKPELDIYPETYQDNY